MPEEPPTGCDSLSPACAYPWGASQPPQRTSPRLAPSEESIGDTNDPSLLPRPGRAQRVRDCPARTQPPPAPQRWRDHLDAATGTTAWVGVQLYSESSKPTNNPNGIGANGVPHVGVVFLNTQRTLLEQGSACLDIPGVLSNLALDPSDRYFMAITRPAGISLFTDGDSGGVHGAAKANVDWDGDGTPDDGVYNSELVPVPIDPGLLNRSIALQAFTLNASTGAATGSQVFRTTLRATP